MDNSLSEDDEPTGFTGDRDRPPLTDRMAERLQVWDTVTNHPRDLGEYMQLAADLLALDE